MDIAQRIRDNEISIRQESLLSEELSVESEVQGLVQTTNRQQARLITPINKNPQFTHQNNKFITSIINQHNQQGFNS